MNSIHRVGLVGFGPMGQLVAEQMLPGLEVVATDPRFTSSPIPSVTMTDLTITAQSDVVIIAVPARHLEAAVSQTVSKMHDDALLVDISSVKLFPTAILDRFWPADQHESLLCHPLFGPQSASNGIAGLDLIVTRTSGDKADALLKSWEELGLNIARLSADEHDRQMAEVHAKTFILGRLARAVGDTPIQFHPPSHRAIEMLEALDAAHSPELFEAIVHFNPYAHELIEHMRTTLGTLHQPASAVAEQLQRYSQIDGTH